MDIPWGSEGTSKFVTNVGIITTDGPWGPNAMAAEWTHLVSYKPGRIAVNVGPSKATAENILASKEFGVNLAAEDQNVFASIAGGSTGKQVDKIAVLKEVGAKFYSAEKIKALMLEGAALNAECKLFGHYEIGDHTLFVGDVVSLKVNASKPIVYHQTKYWKVGESVAKPSEEEQAKHSELAKKHAKK
jgi:flavin reductase (DIM6/NTAB) family NADH-FMN oxidoreductase RutF